MTKTEKNKAIEPKSTPRNVVGTVDYQPGMGLEMINN
jgi:hypothetical protein